MKCCVKECGRDATYTGKQLCQKHYFRLRRNGTTELMEKSTPKFRRVMPGKGYQRIYVPDHPLRDGSGYVAEHRKVVYDKYGDVLPPCELCDAVLDWATCHIDHIDRDVTNNASENLRPLCRACNTFRDYPEQHTIKGRHAITYDGKTLAAAEWARQPGVCFSGRQILVRLRSGMTVEQALFSPKKTHNRSKPD